MAPPEPLLVLKETIFDLFTYLPLIQSLNCHSLNTRTCVLYLHLIGIIGDPFYHNIYLVDASTRIIGKPYKIVVNFPDLSNLIKLTKL